MTQIVDLSEVMSGAPDALVQTSTLLPSGALAAIRVRREGPDRYSVSDEGAGLEDVMALGRLDAGRRDRARAADIARRLGLELAGDAFTARDVSTDQLTAAIVYVADASRQWASDTMAAADRRQLSDLGARAESRLRTLFPTRQLDRDREVRGASDKAHAFDLVMPLPGDRLALFALVSPHAASLASAHMKFFDVQRAHSDWPREAITESLSAWGQADMNLLAAVTDHVRDFQSDWRDLEARLAA